ncbi:MAG: aminodeoxychorismate synthase component I [bacterium]
MKLSNTGREPVYRGVIRVRLLEIDLPPEYLFAPFADRQGSMFLDSSLVDRYGLGRWSFIVYDPLFTLSSRDKVTAFRIGSRLKWEHASPFDVLKRNLALFSVRSEPSWIPFRGGVAGYFAYEGGRQIEKLPATVTDDLDLPETYLGFYDTVLAYDHIMEQWFICYVDFGLKRPTLEQRMKEVREAVRSVMEGPSEAGSIRSGELRSNFTRDGYLDSVRKAKDYILAGDIYQVNLSQRFHAPVMEGTAWDLYWRLRQKNSAPFAAFIQAGDFQIMSSSPERFLRVKGQGVETRPIKGTRPRGTNPRDDAWYRAQLLSSEKDRAELNMIVDLERNDLGRVCEYGTVRVTRHAQCESYSRVHHLVSTVEGELREQTDVTELLKATFPGGSITGAPKIRAMQIIDELETKTRSVYTGSIGYIGFDGDLDLNIAIRTMIKRQGEVYFGAGGGIVYDSDPESEYDETYDKAHALIEAMGSKVDGF